MGTCGCCSVLVNGKPRLSCLMLAQEANGASITTVEGLANGHHLHPIQETFTTHGGSQFGFCTSGFLVVILALLEANPTPSDPETKAAIDGNLCRCTGYQQIVDSVRAASEIITSESQTPDPTEAHSDPRPGLAVESAHTSTAPQVPETEPPEATSTDAMEPASTQERGE